MILETNTTIKNLAALTIYNQQSADATDSLIFPIASHMWNRIRHVDDNSKSSALHYHFIQSNLDSDHIQVHMGLMNNIDNKTITLWQTITKAFTLTIADASTEIRHDVAGVDNSLQLRPTQIGAKFLLTLSDNIQPLAGSQQLDFIRRELGMSIFKSIVKVKKRLLSP